MPKANLWSKSVPRVELDRRARVANSGSSGSNNCLCRCHDLCLVSFGTYGEAWQGNRGRGPLSNRQPSRVGQCV